MQPLLSESRRQPVLDERTMQQKDTACATCDGLVWLRAAGDAQAQEEMVKAVPMLAEIVAYDDLKVCS